MCVGVKNHIITCENVCFGVKKGMSEFQRQVAPKHTTSDVWKNIDGYRTKKQ